MEGEAGAGEEAGGVVAGEAGDPGGLGDGQLDRGDAGRAGLAAVSGQRRAAGVEPQVSVAGGVLGGAAAVSAAGGRGGGEGDGAGDRGADGGGPELGEGGQGGVPADRGEGPGPGTGPSRGCPFPF